MPKFTVAIKRTREDTQYITISAADEDAADEKAQAIIDALETDVAVKEIKPGEWELQDESFEVEDISEE